jgi:hypothetical protein
MQRPGDFPMAVDFGTYGCVLLALLSPVPVTRGWRLLR